MNIRSMLNFSGLSRLVSFARRSVVGLDLGSLSVKASEVGKSPSGGLTLFNYGIFDNYQKIEIVMSSSEGFFLSNEAETAKLIQWLLSQSKISTQDVNIAIPSSFTFTTLISFPYMPEAEIIKAIPFEARQYVPMPISQVALDWSLIKGPGEGPVKVFLAAVPYEIIEKYKRIAKLAKLNLLALEFENFSSVRALMRGATEPTLLVDIGAHLTRVMSAYQGSIYVSKNIEFAGNTLTSAIAKGTQVDYVRAEAIKRDRGLRVLPQEVEIKNRMLPILDNLGLEMKRELQEGEKAIGKRIERIVFYGGSASLAGFLEYLAPQFPEYTLVVGSPFKDIEIPKNVAESIKGKSHKLVVATGLALRDFIQK